LSLDRVITLLPRKGELSNVPTAAHPFFETIDTLYDDNTFTHTKPNHSSSSDKILQSFYLV